ncbi:MAG: hypothetical protein ABIG20_04335 [archaeon]
MVSKKSNPLTPLAKRLAKYYTPKALSWRAFTFLIVAVLGFYVRTTLTLALAVICLCVSCLYFVLVGMVKKIQEKKKA